MCLAVGPLLPTRVRLVWPSAYSSSSGYKCCVVGGVAVQRSRTASCELRLARLHDRRLVCRLVRGQLYLPSECTPGSLMENTQPQHYGSLHSNYGSHHSNVHKPSASCSRGCCSLLAAAVAVDSGVEIRSEHPAAAHVVARSAIERRCNQRPPLATLLNELQHGGVPFAVRSRPSALHSARSSCSVAQLPRTTLPATTAVLVVVQQRRGRCGRQQEYTQTYHSKHDKSSCRGAPAYTKADVICAAMC